MLQNEQENEHNNKNEPRQRTHNRADRTNSLTNDVNELKNDRLEHDGLLTDDDVAAMRVGYENNGTPIQIWAARTCLLT